MAHRKIRCLVCGHELLADENPDSCLTCHEQQWEYLCEARGEKFRDEGCPWCGYTFNGEEFQETSRLARAFVCDWELALLAMRDAPPLRWVQDVLSKPSVSDLMKRVTSDPTLDAQQQLTLTVALFDPSLPLLWHGHECDESELAEEPLLALKILDSAVPNYCREIGVHKWLTDLEHKWRGAELAISKCLPPTAARPSPAGVLSLVLGNPAAFGMTEALPLAMAMTMLRMSDLSSSFGSPVARRTEFPHPPPLVPKPDRKPTPPERRVSKITEAAAPVSPIRKEVTAGKTALGATGASRPATTSEKRAPPMLKAPRLRLLRRVWGYLKSKLRRRSR